MKELIINNNILNEEKLNKMKFYLLPKVYMIFIFIATALYLALSLFFLVNKDIKTSLLFIAIAILFLFILKYRIKKMIKTMLDRFEEIKGKREVNYNLRLLQEGIEIEDVQMNSKSIMKYDIINKFIEMDDFYMIMSKAKQFIVIEKKNLNDEDKNVFENIIKTKATNIKKWKSYKK